MKGNLIVNATVLSRQQLETTVRALNKLIADNGPDDALRGIVILAVSTAVLLDFYANPNPVNPIGMCDNPDSLREYFCEVIMAAGKPLVEGGESDKAKGTAPWLN